MCSCHHALANWVTFQPRPKQTRPCSKMYIHWNKIKLWIRKNFISVNIFIAIWRSESCTFVPNWGTQSEWIYWPIDGQFKLGPAMMPNWLASSNLDYVFFHRHVVHRPNDLSAGEKKAIVCLLARSWSILMDWVIAQIAHVTGYIAQLIFLLSVLHCWITNIH